MPPVTVILLLLIVAFSSAEYAVDVSADTDIPVRAKKQKQTKDVSLRRLTLAGL